MQARLLNTIGSAIREATGVRASCEQLAAVSGGSINRAMRLRYGITVYFVKLNTASMLDMFAAEAAGLREMRQAPGLYVPEPVCHGQDGQTAWLVMENLELGGRRRPRALGEGLAAMHRITQTQYGWQRDNTIGATPQPNTQSGDWVDFWRRQRLQFQLDLAAANGAPRALLAGGEDLLERFPALFAGHAPAASLLHGDLWSGNHAYTRSGEPAIFDPAVYYGDREADLAMTELFGGFGDDFYAAYNACWPLDPGYGTRKTLYNLYHILNHFNLFGGGYAGQAQRMTDALLSELRR